ncbi:hypothetical protein ABPG74_005739 [Tetrahymena malaccensis]
MQQISSQNSSSDSNNSSSASNNSSGVKNLREQFSFKFDMNGKFDSEQQKQKLNDYLNQFDAKLDKYVADVKEVRLKQLFEKYGVDRVCDVCESFHLDKQERDNHIIRQHKLAAFDKGLTKFLCQNCLNMSCLTQKNLDKHLLKCVQELKNLNPDQQRKILLSKQLK